METVAFFSLFLLAGLVRSQSLYNLTEKEFELQFGKHFKDKNEEKRFEQALIQSEQQINAQNELYNKGEASFYEELTYNSDLPKDVLEKEREGAILSQDYKILPEDFKRSLGAILPSEDEWYTHQDLEAFYETMDRQSIPISFDGNAKGLVTPVKDQGNCGSCAIFAATSVHETTMIKAGASFSRLDLSEQQLLDCAFNSGSINGCNGADSAAYGTYFTSKLGGQAVHEYSYIYVGKANNYICRTTLPKFNSGAYVTKTMADYYCTEDKLKALVATYGSAVSYLYASDSGFSNYAGGIFNGCTSKNINHAIVVTGYGTDHNYGDYWIVKNSWGKNWGQSGYMKIKRGSNMCGIGTFCYAAQGARTGPYTPPPPRATDCDFKSRYGDLKGSYIFYTQNPPIIVQCNLGRCFPKNEAYYNACLSICNKLNCSV